MAKDVNCAADLGFENDQWRAADVLRSENDGAERDHARRCCSKMNPAFRGIEANPRRAMEQIVDYKNDPRKIANRHEVRS